MAMEKLPGGNETILIVDDQETVWDFLIEALQNLGYSVLLAENGEDAVSIYRDNPHQIDLVLLDMVMPVMDENHITEKDFCVRLIIPFSGGVAENKEKKEFGKLRY